MFNVPAIQLLTASIIAGVLGVSGFLLSPLVTTPTVDVRIEPSEGAVIVGEVFVINIIVTSEIPVNAFQGLLSFDSSKLEITTIDYNTSIANLWAEEPWYSNGDGTLTFIGGTTAPGGFTGEGSLVTVTFKTKSLGEAQIALDEIKILQHDGLGTLVDTPNTIDALFAVAPEALETDTVLKKAIDGPTVTVVTSAPSIDLNGDGRRSIVDTSIFMTDIITQNLRSDFNQDAVVNLKDLSILNQS